MTPEPTDLAADGPPSSGYSLVLPPGWSRIPLRHGTEEAIRELVKRTVAKAPENVPPDELAKLRVQLEGRLRETAAQAAENAGLDLYLPTAPRGEVAITGSIVVSELQLQGGRSLRVSDVVTELVARENTQKVDVDGADGARTARVTAANPERGLPYGSRHVDYALPVPGDTGRWITVAFSTPGDGDPEGAFADVLVELFDAMMTTFRWEHDHGARPLSS